jgi:hypothetical protein
MARSTALPSPVARHTTPVSDPNVRECEDPLPAKNSKTSVKFTSPTVAEKEENRLRREPGNCCQPNITGSTEEASLAQVGECAHTRDAAVTPQDMVLLRTCGSGNPLIRLRVRAGCAGRRRLSACREHT